MAKEFSSQTREIMYQVIQFVKSEKYKIKIPLNNVNERLCTMLGVSSRDAPVRSDWVPVGLGTGQTGYPVRLGTGPTGYPVPTG